MLPAALRGQETQPGLLQSKTAGLRLKGINSAGYGLSLLFGVARTNRLVANESSAVPKHGRSD